MNNKQQLEEFYLTPDPWGYKSRADDVMRKKRILSAIPKLHYKSTLDIGCGEGFITTDLPGDKVLGIDLSDNAISRTVETDRVTYLAEDINNFFTNKKFDLVVCTGILYPHFVNERTIKKIIDLTSKVLVTCHAREIGDVDIPLKPKHHEAFEYDNLTEDLFVYDISNSRN